jgi:hypothetical protein
MTELFKKPSLQATVSPSGWRSIKVQTQQAAPSPLIDLGVALGVLGKTSQQVAGIQAFEYKQGVKEGEIAAASADLDEALTSFDTVGEDLVTRGLMPRSQLAGYQVGFRKQTGRRAAKSNFNAGLQARLKEVELNPENANFDVIDQIIQDEETKALESLRQAGGTELALQGFSEYSPEIKDRFKLKATQLRDKAIQNYSENGHIEDFNADFGTALLEAQTPEQIGILQNNIKARLDQLTDENKITRSRVVELFWNGFAKPNIDNLLISEKPQPEKAERVLNSILGIDLTGEKGILGNINREGAKIRDNTVQLRRSIQAARDKIEKDQGENYRTITNLAGPALTNVLGGETGIPELDAIRTDAVKRLLDDTEGDFDEDTAVIAAELIKNKDADKLLQYMSFYNANEAKREAYGRAVLPLEEMAIKIKTRSTAILPQEDITEGKKNIDEYVNDGGTDIKGFINGGAGISDSPVINKEVVAYGNTKEVELEANTWFERSEIYPARENEFESGFNEVIQSLYKNMDKGDVSDMVVREAAPFKERYNKLLKQKQIELKGVPNRDEEIIKAFTEIKEEVIGNFRDIKQAEKNYKESFLEEIQEDERFKVDPLTEITIEEGEEKLRTAVDQYYRYLQQKYLPFVPDDVEQRERELVYAVDLDELGKLDIDSRNKAWDKAGVIRSTIEEDTSGDTLDLEDTELLIHRKWGFRNPQEAIDLEIARKETVLRIDFRETPYFETQAMLGEEFNLIRNEWSTYSQLEEAERNLDDFPIFKKWNRAFGVLTKEDINTVGLAQAELLKGIQ